MLGSVLGPVYVGLEMIANLLIIFGVTYFVVKDYRKED